MIMTRTPEETGDRLLDEALAVQGTLQGVPLVRTVAQAIRRHPHFSEPSMEGYLTECGYRFVKAAMKRVFQDIRPRIQARMDRRTIGPGLSLAQRFQEHLRGLFLAEFRGCGYKRPSTKYVGKHYVTVAFRDCDAAPLVRVTANKVWHPKKKWSGVDCSQMIQPNLRDLRAAWRAGYRRVGRDLVLGLRDEQLAVLRRGLGFALSVAWVPLGRLKLGT